MKISREGHSMGISRVTLSPAAYAASRGWQPARGKCRGCKIGKYCKCAEKRARKTRR